MSKRSSENLSHAEKLLKIFDTTEYPPEYPWVMEFLCKVKINRGYVNTANQQDTIDKLWNKYGESFMNEYARYRIKALKNGWAMPKNSAFSNDVWLRYWKGCEEYEKDPSKGRPILPHRSGNGTCR